MITNRTFPIVVASKRNYNNDYLLYIKQNEIIYWRENLWKSCLRGNFYFDLFSFSKLLLEAHGISYIQYRVIIFNFAFIWRIRQKGEKYGRT